MGRGKLAEKVKNESEHESLHGRKERGDIGNEFFGKTGKGSLGISSFLMKEIEVEMPRTSREGYMEVTK